VRRAVSLALAVTLGACGTSGSVLGTGSLADYKASNYLSPAGYEEKPLSDTHYRIVATGTPTTPFERVEKIAMARAAEIGSARKLPYFKVVSSTRDVRCLKKVAGYKAPDMASNTRPTVVLEATYAPQAADTTFLASDQTFERLKNELASETPSAEAQQAAAADYKARCPG
jgi:hypothetical protein